MEKKYILVKKYYEIELENTYTEKETNDIINKIEQIGCNASSELWNCNSSGTITFKIIINCKLYAVAVVDNNLIIDEKTGKIKNEIVEFIDLELKEKLEKINQIVDVDTYKL